MSPLNISSNASNKKRDIIKETIRQSVEYQNKEKDNLRNETLEIEKEIKSTTNAKEKKGNDQKDSMETIKESVSPNNKVNKNADKESPRNKMSVAPETVVTYSQSPSKRANLTHSASDISHSAVSMSLLLTPSLRQKKTTVFKGKKGKIYICNNVEAPHSFA